MTLLAALLATVALTNIAEITDGRTNNRFHERFDLMATVSFFEKLATRGHCLGLVDATGEAQGLVESFRDCPNLVPGDIVRISGSLVQSPVSKDAVVNCTSITCLSHGAAPKPTAISADDLNDGSHLGKFVSVRGVVIESFRDEIDPLEFFVAISCNREIVYADLVSETDISERLRQLDNAEVEIRGMCSNGENSYRPLTGCLLHAVSPDNIRILRTQSDVFDAPELDATESRTPAAVLQLGRRRIVGNVIAAWQRRNILLTTARGDVVRVELYGDQPLPAIGQTVDASGFTETDLHHINLSHSTWRPSAASVQTPETAPTNIAVRCILSDENGNPRYDPSFHGKTVRITGTVNDCSRPDAFVLEDSGFTIPVDASAVPSLLNTISPSCTVSVSGICTMDADTWKPYSPFPHIRGFTLILRSQSDLTILKATPWWTSERLLAAVCVLLVILAGFSVWNRILSRLVERRSRQLAKEEIAHAATDLRAEERTRLSVELHDTIAQNLTGISLQLDSVQLAAENEPELLFSCIDATRSSLSSCRQNLRDCLWDLRSRAFEEKTLAAAITRTLEPHKGSAEIVLDCGIRTQNCSDNAIHAILCIIRELTVNAIRHGKATRISIRGERKAGGLSFVVTDNGCGFDPDKAPGMDQGHFGLQGIRERVHRLRGTVSIASAAGRGTTVELKNLSTDI